MITPPVRPPVFARTIPIPVPLPPEYTENFLLIGESGTGKTQMAGTFPRPYVFDFDKGVRTLGTSFTNYVQFIEAPAGRKPRAGMYEWGTGWAAFLKEQDRIGTLMDKADWPHDTLVYDSLTTLQDLALSAVLKAASSGKSRYTKGDPVDQGLWGAQMMLIQELVAEVRGWPGLKVFTAHIQKDTNAITGAVEKMALVTGKLAGRLPVYFDEIYFLDVKGIGKERTHFIRPMSDAIHRSARTRIGAEHEAPPSFPLSVWPHLKVGK